MSAALLSPGVTAEEKRDLLEPGAGLLFDAFRALPAIGSGRRGADPIRAATLLPWVVASTTRWFDAAYCGGAWRTFDDVTIVATSADTPPDAQALVPAGRELVRAEVFPATRFDLMSHAERRLYERHYAAYLYWRAQRAGVLTSSQSVGVRVDAWVNWG